LAVGVPTGDYVAWLRGGVHGMGVPRCYVRL
jgi:hypothetical protein